MHNSYTKNPKLVRVIAQSSFSFLLFLVILGIITSITLASISNTQINSLYIVIGAITLVIIITHTMIMQIIKFKYTKYKITPEKIENSYSFISKNTITIPISQITDIQSRVGFLWDKFFGVGTLELYTSGSSGADISLKHISNSNEIYSFISNHSKVKEDNENLRENKKSLENEQVNLELKPNVKIALLSSIISLLIGLFFILIFIGPFLFITLTSVILSNTSSALGFLLMILLSLAIGGGITGLIYLRYKYYLNIVYRFYDTKIEYFDGFLTVQKHTVSYQRITNSNYTQSFVDRILGVSTIVIETAGSSSNLTIRYVNNGEEINSKIQTILQSKGIN